MRFEWWWLEGGSGSIGRVVVVFAIDAGDGVTHVLPVAEGYVIGGWLVNGWQWFFGSGVNR